MTTRMTCELFAETLPNYLEREVSEPTRTAMESHAVECGDCGSVLADLRKLRIDAANLPELVPSHDLWTGIVERIDAPVIPIAAKRDDAERAAGSQWRRAVAFRRWAPSAAAAALLIAATATTTYYLARRGVSDSAPTLARGETPAAVAETAGVQATTRVATVPDTGLASPQSGRAPSLAPAPGARAPLGTARLVSTKRSAEEVYDNEIARLRTIVERRRTQLDPVTVSVIERNLKVIDEAIAQCKEALGKDPASRFLLESLNKALENKVELLRTAAMLPSRT